MFVVSIVLLLAVVVVNVFAMAQRQHSLGRCWAFGLIPIYGLISCFFFSAKEPVDEPGLFEWKGKIGRARFWLIYIIGSVVSSVASVIGGLNG